MVNLNLIKCAFGKHEFGRLIEDELFNGWVKYCKHCRYIKNEEAPKDKDGNEIDYHEYMKKGFDDGNY